MISGYISEIQNLLQIDRRHKNGYTMSIEYVEICHEIMRWFSVKGP